MRELDQAIRGGLIWAVLVISLWGCGDGDDPSVDAATAMCRGMCKAGLRCVPDGELSYCVENCRVQWSDAQRTDPDAALRLAPCFERFTCEEVFDDGVIGQQALDRCWEAAKPGVVTTPELRDLCAVYSTALFECAVPTSTERCEQNLGMWAPFVHDDVRACLASPDCDSLDECIQGVFPKA